MIQHRTAADEATTASRTTSTAAARFNPANRLEPARDFVASSNSATTSRLDEAVATNAITAGRFTSATAAVVSVTPYGFNAIVHWPTGIAHLPLVISTIIAWIAAVGRIVDPGVNIQFTTPRLTTMKAQWTTTSYCPHGTDHVNSGQEPVPL